MKFFLLTDDYDDLVGHGQLPYEETLHELEATKFDDAFREALVTFTKLEKYKAMEKEYPRNPRLVCGILADPL